MIPRSRPARIRKKPQPAHAPAIR